MLNQNVANERDTIQSQLIDAREKVSKAREATLKAVAEKESAQGDNIKKIKELEERVSFFERDQEKNREIIIEKDEEYQLLNKKYESLNLEKQNL